MDSVLAKTVQEWDRIDDGVSYAEVHEHIDYLAKRLYSHFEPTQSPRHGDFDSRLRQWLDSAPNDENRKLLLSLVPHIFFIGSEEFSSLYRTAMNGPVSRWLIDECGLAITDPNIQAQLAEAIGETWFCGITDSMQLATFCRVNEVPSSGTYRLDWWPFADLEVDGQILLDYMHGRAPTLRRIVLLEDFIGSGNQMADTVRFVAKIDLKVSVLLCPLIICPNGAEKARKLSDAHGNLTYSPVLELPTGTMLNDDNLPTPQKFFEKIRNFVQQVHPSLGIKDQHTTAYGFKNTGALVVMYTNCPNNTLPIIWHTSGDGSWSPVFPRSAR